MPISQRAEAKLNSISRADVEKTTAGLGQFIRRSKWLGSNNSYAKQPTQELWSEFGRSPGQNVALQEPKHMSQYIAASGIHHCTDGWGYLGKAINALLRGDPHTCLHLAYYAELRAAMSLLSMEGIGIFDRHHTFINGLNSAERLPTSSGTHVFAAECLKFLGEQPRATSQAFSTIRPAGIDLSTWLAPVGGMATSAALTARWIAEWGMDIQIVEDDRHQRNNSSYRPTGLPEFWDIDASKALNFVHDFWKLLEPSANSPFEEIDRHILRFSVESAYRGKTGKAPSPTRKAYGDFIRRILEPQSFSNQMKQKWTAFLTRNETPDDPTLFALSRTPSSDDSEGHLAILSRATLLLRLASGSTSLMLKNSGYVAGSFDFWWKELGDTRGLWNEATRPGDTSELWADIHAMLEDINTFQKNTPVDDQSFYTFGTELASTLPIISTCERVAIWGAIPT